MVLCKPNALSDATDSLGVLTLCCRYQLSKNLLNPSFLAAQSATSFFTNQENLVAKIGTELILRPTLSSITFLPTKRTRNFSFCALSAKSQFQHCREEKQLPLKSRFQHDFTKNPSEFLILFFLYLSTNYFNSPSRLNHKDRPMEVQISDTTH